MSIVRRLRGGSEQRSSLTFDQWLDYFNFNGLAYPVTTMGGNKQEEPGADFLGYVNGLYKSNGIVFAVMATRMLLFAEARFQFQQMIKGRPGDLFGTKELQVLETPWPNGTTGDLLSRAIQDADLAGNWFARRDGDSIIRMRPDWMTIVAGSETGDVADAQPLGYIFQPGGPQSDAPELLLMVEEVAHFAPYPDPEARFRGMSWLTPVVREVMADGAATTHKLRFFENGATPNLVVQTGPGIKNEEALDRFKAKFNANHEGLLNKFKTLFLTAGADAKVIGANLKDADFSNIQAAGETRIAAAGGVPPVIAGLMKGLESSTYSNYSQARRRLADGTMRPLWRNFAGSLAPLIRVPAGSRLWYDDRDIAFLREDEKDKAEIQQVTAATVSTLVTAGFEPESVLHAIGNDDLSLLVHSGLYSVQLQKPGTTVGDSGPAPVSDGANGSEVLPTDKTGRALLALLPGKQE